jgi:serine O-acetyltransferase
MKELDAAFHSTERVFAPARVRVARPTGHSLATVVDELCAGCSGTGQAVLRGPGQATLPSRSAVIELVEQLRSVLFPGYFGSSDVTAESMRFHVGSTLDRVVHALQDQVRRGLCFVCNRSSPDRCLQCEEQAAEIIHTFVTRLPQVQALLSGDALAAYEGDPAATGPDEAVFCYPGMMALTNFRLAFAGCTALATDDHRARTQHHRHRHSPGRYDWT